MATCEDQKLWLVLDLDHTLLHTGTAAKLSDEDFFAIGKLASHGGYGTLPDLFEFSELPFAITKLRPFVDDFLREASEMFHLCVCTMGTRWYAEMMVSLLDPEGCLFENRMICREDLVEIEGKTMKRLDALPGGPPVPSRVLILDDRPHVWPHDEYAANLIAIDRYIFFPFDESGTEDSDEALLRGRWLDESMARGPLAYVLSLLKEIYRGFCLDPSSDVRGLLRTSAFAAKHISQGFRRIPNNEALLTSFSAEFSAANSQAYQQQQLDGCVERQEPPMGALQCLPCC